MTKLTQAREYPGHPAGAIIPSLPCNEPHTEPEEMEKWHALQLRGTYPGRTQAASPQKTFSLKDVTNCPNTWRLDIISPHHAVTVEQPSLPPHVPLFKPSVPEVELTDVTIRAPQHIPGIVHGEAVIRTPDPRPQPLPCRTMPSGMDNPVNCSTPWGLPPTSDAPGSTSNGPSRDKSAGTESNWVSVSVGDDPECSHQVVATAAAAAEAESPSINELSPARRLSIDAGPPPPPPPGET